MDIYIPKNGIVDIDLLNTLGQKIKTVFSGTMTRGKHSLDLTDKINTLPQGAYLLRIQAGINMLSVKLVKQ